MSAIEEKQRSRTVAKHVRYRRVVVGGHQMMRMSDSESRTFCDSRASVLQPTKCPVLVVVENVQRILRACQSATDALVLPRGIGECCQRRQSHCRSHVMVLPLNTSNRTMSAICCCCNYEEESSGDEVEDKSAGALSYVGTAAYDVLRRKHNWYVNLLPEELCDTLDIVVSGP